MLDTYTVWMHNSRHNKERAMAKCSERNANGNDQFGKHNGCEWKSNLYLYIF